MKAKNIAIILLSLVLFGLTSCSKMKIIEKKLPSSKAELISITQHDNSTNGFDVWFYCKEADDLPIFLKEYDCTDLDEWTFTDTSEDCTFFYNLNSSLRSLEEKNIEKEYKTGFYVKMDVYIYDKDVDVEELRVFYVIFNEPTTNKAINMLTYNNVITNEISSDRHHLGKIF